MEEKPRKLPPENMTHGGTTIIEPEKPKADTAKPDNVRQMPEKKKEG
ncbi:MAG: hypothetical protein ABIJ86_07375 [Spirochaetota bacterium]